MIVEFYVLVEQNQFYLPGTWESLGVVHGPIIRTILGYLQKRVNTNDLSVHQRNSAGTVTLA